MSCAKPDRDAVFAHILHDSADALLQLDVGLASNVVVWTTVSSRIIVGWHASFTRHNRSVLGGNELTELPAGIFDKLTSLKSL